MEPIKLHVYVGENLQVIQRLYKAGYISGRIINSYRIWKMYQAISGTIKGKMDRYRFIAKEMGASERSVMRAIDEMEKRI